MAARFSYLMFLIVLVAFCGCSTAKYINFRKATHVFLRNEIGSGVVLNYHCQSKDDDLGNRTLAYDEEWEWEFKTSIWFNTLFWCRMDWWDDINKVQIRGAFDIYYGLRDIEVCHRHCYRTATYDGVYDSYSREPYLVWRQPKRLRQSTN
ncbi:hypothetical protein IFM89_003218 [Coptis chinensis]|uniref:S-protein homolog n=1 Tax=Coptis chinensis TaxID=261450 RepID=A0A835H425_9MAGN|nr:hypothetical protein IFM89_003218 [Coptis chinensis]